MDQTRLNKIVQVLTAKGVNRPCPRCNHPKFSVAGETNIMIQEQPGSLVIGGPTIPAVIVVCENCGYITQHASIPLGLTKGS